MKKYVKGNYRRSIFSSDKGYVIGLFKVRETNDTKMEEYINKTITFTGYFHELNPDDLYMFYGEEIDHPRYGKQYQVTEYERIKPIDKDGVIAFLSSDLFPGIGEAMAKHIVEVLGDDALNQILLDPSSLMLVPKLSSKKASNIYETLKRYEESHKTIVYLNDLGFSMKDSLSIYNTYRDNTNAIISNNCYRILDDINDLNFSKVDEVALKLSYELSDHRRIEALIIYVMNNLVFQNGDTYLEYNEIYNKVCEYLNDILDSDLFIDYVDNLINEDKIIVENNHYYLKKIYDAEVNIVNKIKTLNSISNTHYKHIEDHIKAHEEEQGIIYNDKQKQAIISAIKHNIVIITGGPGTGKTTIIKEITSLYQELNKLDYEHLVNDIALLAPTGRASKRMSEATNLPAMTIHRYLKWNKETNEFAVNEKNKTDSKLIIVDEVSMIDINLLDSLFKGINNHVKVILVGDYNQLPSVGPGQVLKDLIDSDLIMTISLEHLYRQDEDSYIPALAKEVKENNLSNFLDTRSDYTFLKCSSNSIKENIKSLCEQIVAKNIDYKKVQVMAPIYASDNGIDNLNKELQKVFNPKSDSKNEYNNGDAIFRELDKVIQLVNMPDEGVFNGDIGIIKKIIRNTISDSGKTEIYVDYDTTTVKYYPKDFIKIKHAYIISIHKSQGSEFDIVVMPLSNSYKRMLYRKLIYTGITRAKKKLILLGEAEAFIYAVNNNSEYLRKSSLLERLLNAYRN